MVVERVILYDGVCRLCDGAVRFILPRDRNGVFRFAPIQGSYAQMVLTRSGVSPENALGGIWLLEGEKLFSESSAMLRIVARLRFPWNLLAVFLLVPRPIRDAIYGWVAKNRYRWFGKEESCLMPQAEWRDRFIDSSGI